MSILLEALKKAEQAQSHADTTEGFDFTNTATVSLSSAPKLRERETNQAQIPRATESSELTLDPVSTRVRENASVTEHALNPVPSENSHTYAPEHTDPITDEHTVSRSEEPDHTELAPKAHPDNSTEPVPAVLYHRFVARNVASTRWYYVASALGVVVIVVLLAAYFLLLKGTDGALIDTKAIRHIHSINAEPVKTEVQVAPEQQAHASPREASAVVPAPNPTTPLPNANTPVAPPVAKEPVVGVTPQFVLNESRSTAFIEPSTQKSVRTNKQTKAIEIVKHQELNRPEFALLQQAYLAYQKANWEKAHELYARVQKHDPHQRDALLGLAAIARHQQQLPQARHYYQILLQLNPKDADAWSGLMSLQEQNGGIENLATLKQMILQDPNAAALHFSLGNNYAAQGQWMDAQQSYFQAHNQEPRNGDYAYNLAVSLDHLNQVSAAIRYYQLALNLTQTYSANFERAVAQARLQRLSKKDP